MNLVWVHARGCDAVPEALLVLSAVVTAYRIDHGCKEALLQGSNLRGILFPVESSSSSL